MVYLFDMYMYLSASLPTTGMRNASGEYIAFRTYLSDLGDPMYLSSEGFYVVMTDETGSSYFDVDPQLHFECLEREHGINKTIHARAHVIL